MHTVAILENIVILSWKCLKKHIIEQVAQVSDVQNNPCQRDVNWTVRQIVAITWHQSEESI